MNANLKNKKTIALLSTVGVLAIALISFTLAMLNQRSQAATNNFSGATVNIGVLENGEIYEDSANGKSNTNSYDRITEANKTIAKEVRIKNIYDANYPTSDTYVRVRLVPCLRYDADYNENGRHETAGELVPVDMTGKVTYNDQESGKLGDNWVKWPDVESNDDVYYYYKLPLSPDQATSNLIETVTYTGDLPENTHFELQVLTEGVSAKQADAAKNAWGDIPELQKPAPAADTTTN